MQPNTGQDGDWQQPTNASGFVQTPQEELPQQDMPPEDTQGVESPMNTQGVTVETEPSEDDSALVRWQATEYVQQDRGNGWYVGLAIVVVLFMLIAIFLMKAPTFAVLVPVMAAALVIYTKRPPAVIDYTLSRKGLHVNDRLYPYNEFRSFSVMSYKGVHTVHLAPRKRFQLGQSVNLPQEVGEVVVDMLAARLPMKETKPDFFDKLISRLRL